MQPDIMETEHTRAGNEACRELEQALLKMLAGVDQSTQRGALNAMAIRAQLAIVPTLVRWMMSEREAGKRNAQIFYAGLQALACATGTVIGSNVEREDLGWAIDAAVTGVKSYLRKSLIDNTAGHTHSTRYRPTDGRA